MKLKDFRKLLLGANPEAEVVFTLTSGVRVHNAEIVGVLEHNATPKGYEAHPVVDVQVRIKTPLLNDPDFNWETGKPKVKETDKQLEISLSNYRGKQ